MTSTPRTDPTPDVGTPDVAGQAPDDSRRVAVVLGLLFGIAGLGSSSAAITVPLIADDFGVGAGAATWTISLYVLMLAVTTAVYGRVSDLVGTRVPLLVGVGLMTSGAIIVALAPTFPVLLAARMMQGAGAAAVPTLGVAILNSRYSGEVRGLALGRLAAIAASVSCLGPLAGGLVEHALGWRAVMALPVLGLAMLPIIWRSLSHERTGRGIDVLGAVLVAVTAAGVVLIVQSPSTGVVVLVLGAALVVVGTPATTTWVRHRPEGFLPLAVVRNPDVLRNAAAAAAVPAAWFALLVAVPGVLVGDGWEPWQVGLLLVPSAAVALTVPRLTTPLLAAFGASGALAVAGVVATVALLLAALGAALLWSALLAVAVVLVTVSFGVGQPALSAAVADAVHEDVRGVALGIATLVFLVGGSIGSAVVGGVGGSLGVPQSLLLLAVLPVLGLVALVPGLRAGHRERTASARG